MDDKSRSQGGGKTGEGDTKARSNSFDLDIAGGKHVTITAPTRDLFADNLSGAVQFSIASVSYWILERFGSVLGAFLGGVGVAFLDRIEPSLIKYTQPLIDLLLSEPTLEPELRAFLTQLREPTDAGAATILSGFASQAGGMVFSSVVGALLAPVTMQLNKRIRPAIPDVSALITMFRRGQITSDGMRELMAFSGYKEELIDGFIEITQQ
ncbi:MAG: hypothetical protein PHG61_06860, partial [Candidatus Marinimicrobia bacterium]|nr:hypothetical protein [Candidatus Neomarinimicrobiota bacterium]